MKNSIALYRGLKRLFATNKSNWKVVALCVLGATTFWFFNALNKDYATRINYPIQFVYEDSGTVVTNPLPEKVSMVVSGGGWNLLRKTLWFNATPIQIALDNPTYQKYITKSSLNTVINDQLTELRLNYVVTDTLFVSIERQLTKKVRVKVDSAALALADNIRLSGPIQLQPDSVLFTGPQSFIDGLADSVVVYVPEEDISGAYAGTIELSALKTPVVQIEPQAVEVNFPTEVFLRQTRQVAIRAINLPENKNIQLKDTVVQLSFTVSQNKLESLPPGSFNVLADFTEYNATDSTISLKLGAFPAVAENVSIQPLKTRVIYKKPKRRSKR